jgi:hypothetical protein
MHGSTSAKKGREPAPVVVIALAWRPDRTRRAVRRADVSLPRPTPRYQQLSPPPRPHRVRRLPVRVRVDRRNRASFERSTILVREQRAWHFHESDTAAERVA